ncbi:MAG: hypothetical protein WC218_03720 [Candidatus Cloacimonadales bacterium]
MLFLNSKNKVLRKKSEIQSFLAEISKSSHVLSSIIDSTTGYSKILECSEYIRLKQITPSNKNTVLQSDFKYKFIIEAVHLAGKYDIEFETSFVHSECCATASVHLFTLPDRLKYVQKPYFVYPKPEDNISISFQLKGLPEFRKANYIDAKEIHFNGDLEHYLKEHKGKIIYNIELKLPFEKIIVSGVFKKVKTGVFGFENYLYSEKSKKALEKYFQYDFLRNNPNMRIMDESYTKELANFAKQSAKKNNNIVVYDEIKAVTAYVAEYLSKRVHLKVIQVNDFTEMSAVVKRFCPTLLILSEKVNEESISKYNDFFNNYPCCIIITKSPHSDIKASDINSVNVRAMLDKPIDGKALLTIVENIFGGSNDKI